MKVDSGSTLKKAGDKVKDWLVPRAKLFWPLALASTTLVFSEYLKNFNYQSLSIRYLRLPLVLAVALAGVVASVFGGSFRRNKAAGLIAAVLATAVLSNEYESKLQMFYGPIRALVPLMPPVEFEAVVISLAFMAIVLILAKLAAEAIVAAISKRGWDAAKTVPILLTAIVFVFLSQFLPAARIVAGAWSQYFYRPPSNISERPAKVDEKPDIYYLVFDRYASQEVLSRQFSFGNEEFSRYLAEEGFRVDADARSNYPYTPMSISSTLLADYHHEIASRFGEAKYLTHLPFFRSIKYSPVIRELKSLGYAFHNVASNYEASNTAPLSDKVHSKEGQLKVFGRQYGIDSFSQGRLVQSPFLRLMQLGWWGLSFSDQDSEKVPLNQLEILEKLAEEPAGGRFIFAHVLLPHDPFYFNADGSLSTNTDANNIGTTIEHKYLEQVKYVNTRLSAIIKRIDEQSQGRAAVILQADEGPYPFHFIRHEYSPVAVSREVQQGDMREWTDQELKMKYGILAAYRLPGASDEELAQAADPVNIFRLVLNHYFDYHLPYLPRCYFGFPEGAVRAATFVDLTERLTGQSNPACSKVQ